VIELPGTVIASILTSLLLLPYEQQILFLVAFSTYLKHERVPTIAEFQDALECTYV
jgi:hypothetical protein